MKRIAFCLLASSCVCGASSAFDIAVPPSPEPSVAFAAEELSSYVSRITGVRPEIVTNDAPKLGVSLKLDPSMDDDSFEFKARNGLFRVRGGVRGILYGVYEMLERFGGVDWLSSWRTVVPKGKFELPAELDERQSPALALREIYGGEIGTNIPFAVHLRVNGLRSHSGTKPYPVDAKYGGRAWRFVNGLKNCHTFTYLVPLNKHYKDHPEYYALVDGVRRDVSWQLCLTNPDVLRIATEKVLELADADPTARMIGVSHNDNRRNYCRCERCAAVDAEEESHAGTELRFVNAIADEVKKRHPGMLVQTLAYQYTRKPPKYTRPRDNVVITLCSIECDRLRPFGSPGSADVNKAFVEDLLGWAKMTDKLYVWDYTGENLHYIYPMPNAHTVFDNVKFFRDHNVKFYFSEGNSTRAMHPEFSELKCYLIAKALWNPDQPLEPLLDRFFNGYYGKAAPFVREYYEKSKRHALGLPPEIKVTIYQSDSKTKYPDAFLAESLELWNRAEKAVSDDPETLYNVRMGKASVLRLVLDRMCEGAKWVWATDNPERFPKPNALAPQYMRFLQNRVADAAKKGFTMRFGNTPQREKRAWEAWGRYVSMAAPDRAQRQARVGVEDMQLSELKFATIVEAKDAFGGKAIETNNRYEEETAYLDFANVAYDSGADYRVRIRIKVLPLPGGKGEAVRLNCGKQTISIDAKDVPLDWTWYEFEPFRPKSSDRISVRPGHRVKDRGGRMAFDKILVDEFEITKIR